VTGRATRWRALDLGQSKVRINQRQKHPSMAAVFDYDWFTGPAFERQKTLARELCARKKFPEVTPEQAGQHADFRQFHSELETRTLIYLRDGFSYELKRLVDLGVRSMLTFECEPVDEQYKVGAFVVSALFEEIVRVEVFAVHPSEKPEDTPMITGFRNRPNDPLPRDDPRDARDQRTDATEPEQDG
jgi:hypothetical protein